MGQFINITAFGRSLVDDADASAARTTLGLGTAATQNTGTSGANVPLLNGTNTHSGATTFTAGLSSTRGGANNVVIGPSASCTVSNAVCIGNNITVGNGYSIGIGTDVNTGTSSECIILGNFANTSNYSSIVVIGINAYATGNLATAIGKTATAGVNSFAIGESATASGVNSIAIGGAAIASHTSTISIGRRMVSAASGDITLGYGESSTYPVNLRFMAASSTTNSILLTRITSTWATSTHASRKARVQHLVSDASSDREFLRAESDGSNANISFFGAGSWGGGSAVIFLKNAATAPSSDPTGGGILWAEGGAMKWGAAGGASLLFDLQIGAASKFKVSSAGVVTIADGGAILASGTIAGLKIGGDGDKLGFFNATPIVQGTITGEYDKTAETGIILEALLDYLASIGLLVNGTTQSGV